MIDNLAKAAFLLMAGLLLAPTAAHAAASCAPEEMSLEVDMNEPEYAYVVGELQTPKQEYTYRFGPVSDPNEKGIAMVELKLEPPTEELLFAHVDKIKIEEELFVPDDAKYLVVKVNGDFSWGPDYFIAKMPEAGYSTCMKMKMKSTQ